MFRPLRQTLARWRRLEGEGLEHLTIGPIETAPARQSAPVALSSQSEVESPMALCYRIDCLPDWAVVPCRPARR
jgi:hypothetical protein